LNDFLAIGLLVAAVALILYVLRDIKLTIHIVHDDRANPAAEPAKSSPALSFADRDATDLADEKPITRTLKPWHERRARAQNPPEHMLGE